MLDLTGRPSPWEKKKKKNLPLCKENKGEQLEIRFVHTDQEENTSGGSLKEKKGFLPPGIFAVRL